jgi:carboxyl-terminal processing protease
MSKVTRAAGLVLLFVVFIAAILVPLYFYYNSPSDEPDLSLIREAWQVIVEDHVDSGQIDPDVLIEGAIQGMLEALDDPFSAYFNAERNQMMNIDIEGEFGGIGAEVTIVHDQLTVVAPIKGTPAEKEGIKPRDRILAVDGESTEGMSLEEAVRRIRGEPGTSVTLRVLHQDDQEPVDIMVTREVIKLNSVYYEILPDSIAHITVTQFSARTGAEIFTALKEINANGATGIILDLRDNPGGVLSSAVTVASQFLDHGIVLYALDNEGERDDWHVEPGGLATTLPLAVLVNSNSASGSEVVAGALQDNGRGRLIGTTTFGKGSVNHIRDLSDGSAIYITIARWHTPNGRQIEGQGLSPDEEVEITAEDLEQGNDPQLERAIEYIKSQQLSPTSVNMAPATASRYSIPALTIDPKMMLLVTGFHGI